MVISLQMEDRALATFYGVALGDALGMPSQTLPRSEIHQHYGVIEGFLAPYDTHPVAHGLKAGAITDDTEQSIVLAEQLAQSAPNFKFDEEAWAQGLIQWEQDVKRRGIHDLLGPSTKKALEALLNGVPASETGIHGTTNGAAMRIAPIGLVSSLDNIERFVDRVEQTCRITHNTPLAISTASAVAAVISAGIDGATFEDALPLAFKAAKEGQKRGHGTCDIDVADKIDQAIKLARSNGLEAVIDQIGTSVLSDESVPAAFAVVFLADGDPWQAGLIAANIGDDTDTIGAIACGMAAACGGMTTIPDQAKQTLETVNNLTFQSLIKDLLAIRQTSSVSGRVLS